MVEVKTAKRIVIGMTGLMVLMIVALGWGVLQDQRESSARMSNLSAPSPSAPWQKSLPKGTVIRSLSNTGAYLAVLTDGPTGPVVYLVNPLNGDIRGTILTEAAH